MPAGFDWTGAFLSFKGVALEGLEVAVIVVAFGAAADALGSAIVGAAVALVVIGALCVAAALLLMRIVSGWRRDVAARKQGELASAAGAG